MSQTPGSILNDVKQMIGIEPDYTEFDTDIIVDINSAFMILTQMGIGPSGGFMIHGPGDVWADFFSEKANIEPVKQYVYMKTKQIFDPPTSSVANEAMTNQIKEIEWRLYAECNPYYDESDYEVSDEDVDYKC